MAEPTLEELQQQITDLQQLITAEYAPPTGPEYSYPVANQGITQDQFNNMMLPMGSGIIHRGYSPYYLTGHESDAETNQRNTLILKVDSSDGFSGSSIAGFYHRLTEDMELSFPPVTTTTDYYVTVTYDPRRFKTDPLRIEVWSDTPPRTHGQQHIILNRVRRQPNQLLSQAEITRYRQAVAPTIFVQNPSQLPNPSDVLYGTIAATHSGSMHVSLGSSWRQLTPDPIGTWHSVRNIYGAYRQDDANRLMARTEHGGVRLAGRIRRSDGFSGAVSANREMFQLPAGMNPTTERVAYGWASSDTRAIRFRAKTNGYLEIGVPGITGDNFRIDFNVFIPN